MKEVILKVCLLITIFKNVGCIPRNCKVEKNNALCTGTVFTGTNFLNTLPETIKRLEVQGTLITTLQTGQLDRFKNLEELNLSNNKISSLPPTIFNKLSNLTSLDLHKNEISNLDTSIFRALTNLQLLNIGYNKLTGINPQMIDLLVNLKQLYISHNEITQFNGNIFDKFSKLTILDLSGNQITGLPYQIFNKLKNLKYLYINSNLITQLDSRIFNSLTNLNSLVLADNKMTKLPPKLFDNLSNLKMLYLLNNQITNLNVDIFKKLPKLEYLDLSNNKLSQLDPVIFKNLPDLKMLYLLGNKISQVDVSMFNTLGNMEYLNLANNSISELGSTTFDAQSKLKTLWLNQNMLTDLPAQLFRNTKNLKSLEIQNNDISNLDPALFKNLQNLEVLIVDSNLITSNITSAIGHLKLKALKTEAVDKCSCDVIAGLRDVELRNRINMTIYYSCTIRSTTFDFARDPYSVAEDACATSEWSSWSNPTHCYGDNNGFHRYTRICNVRHNESCVGFGTKASPCEKLYYSSTSRIDGSIEAEDIIKDEVPLSPSDLADLYQSTNYELLKNAVKETIIWLFYNQSVVIQDIKFNYNLDRRQSVLVVYYTGDISSPLTDVDSLNPVKHRSNFTLKHDKIPFTFTLSPEKSNITDVDECGNNLHSCDKNADCLKFSSTIAYACRCKEGFRGDGFSCKDKDSREEKGSLEQSYKIATILLIILLILCIVAFLVALKLDKISINIGKKGEKTNLTVQEKQQMRFSDIDDSYHSIS